MICVLSLCTAFNTCLTQCCFGYRPEDALHGGYVVMVSPLDLDPEMEYHPMCGTIFSVYKRRSSPSVPGRLMDLQQDLGDQVAAGYVVYSSATTLYYTIGQCVYSFCLHPVAVQYFLQPPNAVRLGSGCHDVYGDYAGVKADETLGKAVLDFAAAGEKRGAFYDTGSVIANFSGAAKSGAVFIYYNVHLLCEAAPLALLMEQMGGKASDGHGTRILGEFSSSMSPICTLLQDANHNASILNLI